MFNGRHRQEFIRHAHEVATVVVVTKGAYRLDLDHAHYVVSAGDLVVIGARQFHAAQPLTTAGWEMRTLHAPPRLLSMDLRHEVDRSVSFRAPLRVDRGAAELFLESHRFPTTKADCDRQAEQIDRFVRWFQSRAGLFEPELVSKAPDDPVAQRAASRIAGATGARVLIEEIAEELSISPFALIRRFKKQYGMSPNGWRMQLRAGDAAQRLHRGQSLADVAMDCGFSDQAHMTRVFRKVYGVTPGQYRRMQ